MTSAGMRDNDNSRGKRESLQVNHIPLWAVKLAWPCILTCNDLHLRAWSGSCALGTERILPRKRTTLMTWMMLTTLVKALFHPVK